MKLQSALRVIFRPATRGLACKVPSFPDPPCIDADPMCHHVSSRGCPGARNVINRELPREKFLDNYEKMVAKCCILRSAHRDPCAGQRKKEKELPKEPEPFRSMWEPPCRTDQQPHCTDMLPRFDAIYYTPSNKCRCYQRTWVECPPLHQRVKKVCCLDGIKPPEVLYRIKEECPRTACERDYSRLKRLCSAVHYEQDPTSKCTKMFWPCCKPARCESHCRGMKRPTGCTKLRAPYPSFSELRKKWARPRRPTECLCPDPIPLCVALRAAKRIETLKLKHV
ncbi:uncharacterized protein Dana_GF19809 [Drosophila ananassae]|uniref:Uncharacterized protein n=1 Tax=Drosophila ananassae TaxID=7217 RepID=B3MFZ9_DROAN|nr:uncharacterized protein LOC6502552 isoform X1 [Drosophila ananassae]XP_032306924.1 uncharacterized protein LOC6502552 isoform X1 [Drosophila ananassae]XP_044571681.1 uncharacterized protein LOC6502552 isoform X1 [Drosophila ananassae]EDV35681.1 uncharacterized protein Dana_GF19809 [Drosophila ananassae]